VTLEAITPANDQLTADHFYFPTFIMAQAGGGSAKGKSAGNIFPPEPLLLFL
jgi:hypothetical protein